MLATIDEIAAAALFILLTGCVAGFKTDNHKTGLPSETAHATCARYPPRDIAACNQFHSASEIAYRNCLAYDHIDPQPCENLRRTYEAELSAHLKSGRSAASHRSTVEEPSPPQISHERLQALYRTAQELYDATNKDAQTFAAARLIPEIRQRIERALHRQLSNDVLYKLAIHAQAEALYWYEYMHGLDEIESN